MTNLPKWARRPAETAPTMEPTQTPPSAPEAAAGAATPAPEPSTIKTPEPVAQAPQGPSIREDQWWIDRMIAWQKANPTKRMPPGKLQFWLELEAENTPNDGMPTRPSNLDLLLDRLVEGETVLELAAFVTQLFGFRVSHATLRQAMTASPERVAKYNLAREHKSHYLMEKAGAIAADASRAGDYRAAIDFNVKLAGKLNRKEYGDKSELALGGVTGSPVEVLNQTPAEALKALIAG